tara:strand:- start:1650 stop:2000 length:351 start_codon:yes stop_codon:yes gene_type:complete
MELSQCLEKHTKGIIGNIQFLKTTKDIETFNQSMKAIYRAWDVRQKKMNILSAQSFNVGDAVTFENNRSLKGYDVISGVVKKVKVQNILVESDSGNMWDVPASRLEHMDQNIGGLK